MDSHSPASRPPRAALVRDHCLAEHRRIEELLVGSLDALDAGDDALGRSLWAEGAQVLLLHIDAEERLLLRGLLVAQSKLARTLVAEHNHLRARLVEVEAPPKGRVERRSEMRRFIEELRAHERHEATVIYPWADERLDTQEKAELLGR